MRLPDTSVAAFGCLQNFLYTGEVYDKHHFGESVPDYAILVAVWKLATKLMVTPLHLAVLSKHNHPLGFSSAVQNDRIYEL